MPEKKILILGSNGQLGTDLKTIFPDAEFADRNTFDISDSSTWGDRNWQDYGVIINAAAYTKVDQAESDEGRIEAWKTNAVGSSRLARLASEHDILVVGISTDYVFDGTKKIYDENEPFSPLGVYAQTKAAGDIAIATAPKHYIIRTSWVMGPGRNFVSILRGVAEDGGAPGVVNDQFGRPTFTKDLAGAIKHLIDVNAEYGTYNFSNGGEVTTWQGIAKATFEAVGKDPDLVSGVTAEQYFKDRYPVSPRPSQSTLNLDKIESTGLTPRDWRIALTEYLKK